MARLDPDSSGSIEKDEFTDAVLNYIREKVEHPAGDDATRKTRRPSMAVSAHAAAPDVEEEDDEEMPEDLQQLSPDEQQVHIKRRAAVMMAIGTALVIVFSDPMVEVMSNMGERLAVPPFYVAFILAPLASNASELLASYNYAGKKTRKTITVALASLEGAACMNNTFCLAIFMALIYFRQLAW